MKDKINNTKSNNVSVFSFEENPEFNDTFLTHVENSIKFYDNFDFNKAIEIEDNLIFVLSSLSNEKLINSIINIKNNLVNKDAKIIAITLFPFSFENKEKINTSIQNKTWLENNINSILINNLDDIQKKLVGLNINDVIKYKNKLNKKLILNFNNLFNNNNLIGVTKFELDKIFELSSEMFFETMFFCGIQKLTKAKNHIEQIFKNKPDLKNLDNLVIDIIISKEDCTTQIQELIEKVSTLLENKDNVFVNYKINNDLRSEININLFAFKNNKKENNLVANNLNDINLDFQYNKQNNTKFLQIKTDLIDDELDSEFITHNKNNENDEDLPFFIKK